MSGDRAAAAGSHAAGPAAAERFLEVPGARLAYDVRPGADAELPTLLLVGSPMDAVGFGSLAGRLTDRTVVTYDPRGTARSRLPNGVGEVTPEQHADDLARLIAHLGVGPVDVFASSGGAVNALALVARRPELVRSVVAHEPPLAQLLPERDAALQVIRGIHQTYQESGLGPAMARFIAVSTHQGEVPADLFEDGGPDPAMFGLPTEDEGRRDDALLGQNLVPCTSYQPDLEALRAAPVRLLVAVGEGSGEALAARAARALAERLGARPVGFPGDHGGFLGGEYGQMGEPDAFAARLREVLTDAA